MRYFWHYRHNNYIEYDVRSKTERKVKALASPYWHHDTIDKELAPYSNTTINLTIISCDVLFRGLYFMNQLVMLTVQSVLTIYDKDKLFPRGNLTFSLYCS